MNLMDAVRGARRGGDTKTNSDSDSDSEYHGSVVHWFHLQHRARMRELLQEVEPEPKRRGGSRPGRLQRKNRDAEGGDDRFYKDYFEPTEPVYDDKDFRRRFRMSKRLFLKVVDEVSAYDSYFV